jgi:RNA polymerase sigma factor (TIGR02999 family)
MGDKRGDITQLLAELAEGDASARDKLLDVAYDELKQLAQGFMRRERPDHTLQPTALVHEAVLRIFGRPTATSIPNRSYLFAMAAHAMRRILVEHARRKGAERRGGHFERVPLDDVIESIETTHGVLLLDLEEALKKLEGINRRLCDVVTMRFFGGLEMQQIADHLHVSLTTVERDWRFARAWLRQELKA